MRCEEDCSWRTVRKRDFSIHLEKQRKMTKKLTLEGQVRITATHTLAYVIYSKVWNEEAMVISQVGKMIISQRVLLCEAILRNV
jgi:hypothetical protein